MCFYRLCTNAKERYILGVFNINMYQNSKYIVHKNKTICTKFTSADGKSIISFCNARLKGNHCTKNEVFPLRIP